MRILLLLIASCSGGTVRHEPVGNTGSAPPPAASASVTGKITDTFAPLAGVTVVLDPFGSRPDPDHAFATTVSGEDGRYRFASVPAGRYDVRIYYTDISVHRVVEVRGVTVVDQQIATNGTSNGKMLECASADVKSCK